MYLAICRSRLLPGFPRARFDALVRNASAKLFMNLRLYASDAPLSHAADIPHRRARIMLVEDDAAVRRHLEVTLQRAGFEVVPICDGLKALKQFLVERFDLVITGAVLPYVSGREICRFMRGRPQLAATPILMLSDINSMPADAAAEVDAYLAKPVSPQDLIASVETLLARAN